MFVEAVVFLSAIIGVLLALSAFIFHMITRDKGKFDIEGSVDAVTDAALEEINKTSQLIMDELNEKYNALLFVYQLMDDKKKEIEKNTPVAAAETEETLDRKMVAEHDVEEEKYDGLELDISIGDELEVIPIEPLSEEPLMAEPLPEESVPIKPLPIESLSVETSPEKPLQEELSLEEPLVTELSPAELLLTEPLPLEPLSPKTNLPEPLPIDSIAPQKAESTTPKKEALKIGSHPRYGPVKKLLDEGMEMGDIARQLNMGKGEVQLIIGLMR